MSSSGGPLEVDHTKRVDVVIEVKEQREISSVPVVPSSCKSRYYIHIHNTSKGTN